MPERIHNKIYNYIEGVGDEVIYGAVGVLLAVIATIYMWIVNHNRRDTIHPESQTVVDGLRNRLHTDNTGTAPEQNDDSGGNTQEQPSPSAEPDTPPSSPPPLHYQAPPGNIINCPICLADGRYAVDTNCGHSFCGTCVITYWTHGNWMGAVRCPVCRQIVTLLLMRFTEEENRSQTAEKQQVVRQVAAYNRRFSGEPRPWMDYIYDLPTLLRHSFRHIFSLSGLYNLFRVRILMIFIFGLCYLLSPLDIIPEAVFGFIGLLDDLFIIFILGIYVTVLFRRNLVMDD